MGFRDLNAYNLAMLAKEAWRVICFPNSLIAHIYKAKYFPHGNFWTAALPSSPSFSWRSLVASRDILMSRVRWQVGDCRSINIWTNKWLPRPYSFRPISFPISPSAPVIVSELILEDLKWNEALINSNLMTVMLLLFCPCL